MDFVLYYLAAMNELLIDHFFLKPARMRALGHVLFCAAFVQFMAGMWAQLVTAYSLAGGAHRHPAPGIDNIYPAIWTWWIPETAIGFALVLSSWLLGAALYVAGGRISRLLGE